MTLSPESYLRLPRDLVSLPIGAAWGLSIMLVMSRRFEAGFLGVTGLSGKRGLVMFAEQRLLHPSVSGFSLLRFKFCLKNFLEDAMFFFFGSIQVKISVLIFYLNRNFSFF